MRILFERSKPRNTTKPSDTRHHGQAHQEPLGSPRHPYRRHISSRRRDPRLLLAQDPLGLHDKEPGWSSETFSDITDHQSSVGPDCISMGVAVGAISENAPRLTQKHRSEDGAISSLRVGGHTVVSSHELRSLLSHRGRRLLLGVLRRRGKLECSRKSAACANVFFRQSVPSHGHYPKGLSTLPELVRYDFGWSCQSSLSVSTSSAKGVGVAWSKYQESTCAISGTLVYSTIKLSTIYEAIIVLSVQTVCSDHVIARLKLAFPSHMHTRMPSMAWLEVRTDLHVTRVGSDESRQLLCLCPRY